MPQIHPVSVDQLKLDLGNFRTVPQTDEAQAVNAMLAIRADYLWALMESLIDDGYLPTENIIVLETNENPPRMLVKEGNRRIAALKVIYGYLLLPGISSNIPNHIAVKLENLSTEWKTANLQVPCTVYEYKDAAVVDPIVTLAHGKSEKAGRDQWNAVARARHNRNSRGFNESPLDLLEKYLDIGQNLTQLQRERWAGDYPLTVLEDVMKRLSTRLGVSSAPELAKKYPSIRHQSALDDIIRDIGLKELRFKNIRDATHDFAADYQIPQTTLPEESYEASPIYGTNEASDVLSTGAPSEDAGQVNSTSGSNLPNAPSPTDDATAQQNSGMSLEDEKALAVAIKNPKAVKEKLQEFAPVGSNRQKVVTLLDEALRLNLKHNPIAFCFLLRSMFEISAKAYCKDHQAQNGPSAKKADGQDRNLVDILRDITSHMTTLPNNKKDTAKLKILHGAMAEMAKQESVLSVTSMNNLVHNPNFAVTEGDISTMFGNIFPLLEEMNT